MDKPKGANRSEEPCWDCGGAGCETCNDTGMLYTTEAIRDQIAVEDLLAERDEAKGSHA